MNYAVVVEGLGKQFCRYHPDRPRTLQETFAKGLRWLQPFERFWALRDITFNIERGRMVGVVGPNGSGKSTLLRLIGGVGRADVGRIEVNGRIGALLDLGTCFHPDLTGRENVFISGVIFGLTRREVAARFDSIVAFAELAEFIDNPVRTYSTGMQMRLGFSVAVHTRPEILLIDEVLSVGDHSFQRKCLDRVGQFKAEGSTIILVSHDTELVREFCDAAVWLNSGRLILHGRPDVVINQYIEEADALLDQRALVDAETQRRTPKSGPVVTTFQGTELHLNDNRFGSLELEMTAVQLADIQGRPVTQIESGASLRIEIDYQCSRPVMAPIFQVYIIRDDGLACYDLNSELEPWSLGSFQGKGHLILQIERVDLASGLYHLEVGSWAKNWRYAYDYHSNAYPLRIYGVKPNTNSAPQYHWEFNPKRTAGRRIA
jgi:homopolymeric O-antigen transport system ATP-binding protein